jgi:hypothetical protein
MADTIHPRGASHQCVVLYAREDRFSPVPTGSTLHYLSPTVQPPHCETDQVLSESASIEVKR